MKIVTNMQTIITVTVGTIVLMRLQEGKNENNSNRKRRFKQYM